MLTVGTMNFGTRAPRAEAERLVQRALERGVTRFDTANLYNDGEAERVLGAALGPRKAQAHLTTKVGLWKKEGLGRARVVAALDESLGRLGVDSVDLYLLHAPDPATPIEATLEGIAAVLASGKAKAWGVSNHASWQILELSQTCARLGLPGPKASQVLYNLLIRQLDVEYFRFAAAHPIETSVFNPLAAGLLARELDEAAAIPKGSRFESNGLYRRRFWSKPMLRLAAAFRTLAREHGLEPVALAYAFCAGTPGVDAVVCGPATVAHLDAAVDGCALRLEPTVRAAIDELHRDHVGTDARYAR
ncbi:MAG: aldo/keto reductase [Myxococcaceae bacterium]|nr:aldo/keto reductase [Myxococcaceae bacterium]